MTNMTIRAVRIMAREHAKARDLSYPYEELAAKYAVEALEYKHDPWKAADLGAEMAAAEARGIGGVA